MTLVYFFSVMIAMIILIPIVTLGPFLQILPLIIKKIKIYRVSDKVSGKEVPPPHLIEFLV